MECSEMSDYVLIHGAWQLVLEANAPPDDCRGHRVFTPTLTGLGERVHLLSRDVGLDTHIADVAKLLLWEDLRDIVLVGHSYGGIVVRHVADRLPDRVRSLVYLDAFIPEDGKSLVDHLPDSGKRHREQALAQSNGWKVSPPPASVFAVNAADAAWLDRQCTMHPLSSLEDPDVGEASAEESSDSGSARSARPAFEDGIADAQERFRGLRRPRERAQRLQRRHRWRDRHRVFHPQPTGGALVRHTHFARIFRRWQLSGSPSRKSAAVQGASVRLKGRPGLTTPLLQAPSVLYGLVTFGQFSPISADALFAWNGRS
jgi:pimeloyl-ACP methyl ester carboxylesterase